MKILYISYDSAISPLGQSQIIPYLKKLTRDGLEFILVTYDKKCYRNRDIFRSLQNEFFNSKIRWISLNYHKRPKILAKIYDILIGIIVCAVLLRRDRIRIVHGRSFVGAFIGMVLNRLFRVKFFLDYRGLWPDERTDGGLWPRGSLLYKITKYTEKLLLLNADEVSVLTRRAKETIEKFSYIENNNFRIKVIPTCVDLECFKPNSRHQIIQAEDKLTLIYLGSLGTWYMLEEMIDFFIEMRKIFMNTHFLFITPAEQKTVEKTMESKSVPSFCYSIKSASYSGVPQWLSLADLSIFFIKPLFSKISSCPTKFGESLACGLPVVINSGIGDCDEIVKENKVGVVVNNFSVDAYKKSISELQELWQKKEELNLRCRETSERIFSLDRGVEAYRQIYNRMERKE